RTLRRQPVRTSEFKSRALNRIHATIAAPRLPVAGGPDAPDRDNVQPRINGRASGHPPSRRDAMKHVMRSALVVDGLCLSLSLQAAAQSDTHVMVTPSELNWVDVPSLPPGAKMAVIEGPLNHAKPFIFRARLPANYRIPAHVHPGIEHVT